jgi:putative ABC transport system substrate-binding protein
MRTIPMMVAMLSSILWQQGPTQATEAKVAITQFASHTALDAVRDGVKETIKSCTKGQVIFTESNACGNVAFAGQIGQSLASQKLDAIVALSTLSTQTVVKSARGQIPVVFSAVTDPKEARLTNKPNVTGVTDRPPYALQLNFIKSLVQNLETLAIIYHSGEDNSVASVAEVRRLLQDTGITLKEIPVTSVTDMAQAVQKAAPHIQAIYIANDNFVASSFETLIQLTHKAKIPVFTSDISLVERGAVAMQGVDYHTLGLETGAKVCALLQGTPVAELPITNPSEKPDQLKIMLNLSAAKQTNILIPESLRKQADKVWP